MDGALEPGRDHGSVEPFPHVSHNPHFVTPEAESAYRRQHCDHDRDVDHHRRKVIIDHD
jgi:hypothetical protein